MFCLPTLAIKIDQICVNIQYIECLGIHFSIFLHHFFLRCWFASAPRPIQTLEWYRDLAVFSGWRMACVQTLGPKRRFCLQLSILANATFKIWCCRHCHYTLIIWCKLWVRSYKLASLSFFLQKIESSWFSISVYSIPETTYLRSPIAAKYGHFLGGVALLGQPEILEAILVFEQSLSPLQKLKNVFLLKRLRKKTSSPLPPMLQRKVGNLIPTETFQLLRSIEKLNRNSFTIWNISSILKHHHFSGDICQKETHPPKFVDSSYPAGD